MAVTARIIPDLPGSSEKVGNYTPIHVSVISSLGAIIDSLGSGGSGSVKAATSTLANVAANVASVTLQALNTLRIALIIVNDTEQNLYVKYGSGATTTSYTYVLAPGQSYREDTYTGIVTGIWGAADAGAARMTELTT